jgi:photosystem II stability/assembly factor-like uncharacterized protein
MKHYLLFFFLLIVSTLSAQNPKAVWKPLGPFAIHKQTGDHHAPGLGVMRTVDVSAKNPNRILMGGMSSGIWLSNDKGVTWKNVTASLAVENIKKIEIAPNDNSVAYAATTVGIIKSVDGGNKWQFTSLNMKDKLPCHERWSDDGTLLSISPQNANMVIASAKDSLYKTTDGGKKWIAVLAGFKTQFIESHPINATIVYVGGAYRKEKEKFILLRSIDSGNTFTEIKNGLPDNTKLTNLHDITAAVSPAAPDKLYLLILGDAKVKTTIKQEDVKQMVGAFIVSEDAAQSFKPVKQFNNYQYVDDYYSLFHVYSKDEDKANYDFDYADKSFWQGSFQQAGWATSLAISNIDAATMVTAASGTAFSKDAGTTWNILRKQGQYGIHGDIQQVKIIGDDVWLANDGGLNYVNLKNHLTKRVEGFSGQDLWGFSTSFKTDVMAVGVDHSGTMVYNKNIYGNDWYHYGGGDAMSATINPLDDRWMYAKPYESFVVKLPTTLRDEPITKPSPISFGYISYRNVEFHPNLIYTIYSIHPNDDGWGVKNSSIIRSSDNLKTIDTLKLFPDKLFLKSLRVCQTDANYMYAVADKRRGSASEVWMTEDEGKTWKEVTPQNEKVLKYGFADVAISDENPKHVYLGVAGFQNETKVLFSADGGMTWQDYHSAELPKSEIQTMALQRGTNEGIYLGCEPGVFYRSQSMNFWGAVGKNLPYTPTNFIYLNYDKAKIRIGTHRGVWECDLYEDFAPRALIAMNKNNLPSGESESMKIFFHDHSAIKGKGATWFWECPGSVEGTSTDENPIMDYDTAKPGKYDVRLTITDSKGRKSIHELKDFVTVAYRNEPWNLREKKLETERSPTDENE